MINNSSTEVEQNLYKKSYSSKNIDYSHSLSDSYLPNLSKKNLSNNNLNSSTVPQNLSTGTSQTLSGQNNINANQKQEEVGFFSRIFNYFSSSWSIEEEEYIDAHGFKAKRPKKKIPLRKKEDKINSDLDKAGGQTMAYATQHSGFGNLFL